MNRPPTRDSDRDRCIALAGLFQAAHLAAETAHKGVAEAAPLEASVYSLFQIDAESAEAVFGGVGGISKGLTILTRQLDGGRERRDLEVARYAIALLHLERKLAKNREMLSKIGEGIEQAKANLQHFPMLHPNTFARLAEIYTTTISTLKPRIMVQGAPLHLQNPDNANKIRTLLLAGIRAAMLWRQCGGNRFQLILGRRRILHTAKEIRGQYTDYRER